MGKAITTLIVLAVLIVGGIWIYNRNDDDLALDDNATTTENFSGIGGPEEGFDPLEDADTEVEEDSKG
ncbi:MAG: hypothetical protein A2758_02350 [Candidatus Zambryskibacteria bacterium RIFCSPHIGHO2_01_FULL_49_18]|uniref:Uncharacterized protein n=2 Tax=Candidatus Zambryskiibacteriota TaxID=1817925 RepID=A0A1G2T1Z3_9BACT|nr:MAG: hypothetical protein A2758_02350 [Candidatus Zambryskibacteria bacterium RIFCSPHIGHO2_01_FULL_49_18]OHB06164.1 MAG: hypothetical protein A3A26_01310 [Candidatus Zambryskibacteria bacterium RIFCSPLOWO2_01_FULL_47_14]